MKNVVVTKYARNNMMLARAGKEVLHRVVGMAFGNGGVDESGNVMPIEEDTALTSELLRKQISQTEVLSETTCRYSCSLGNDELVGEKISEIALYDEEGQLLVLKHFGAKTKDEDIEMIFQIDDTF